MIEYLFRLLLSLTLAGSVACALSLLVCRVFRRYLPARAGYLLHLAALLFLLFPLWAFLPSLPAAGGSPQGLAAVPPAVSAPAGTDAGSAPAISETVSSSPVPEINPAAPEPFGWDFILLGSVWLSGAGLLLILHEARRVRYFVLLRRLPLRRPGETALAQYQLAAAELHLQKKPEAWICAGVSSPVLTGILHPRILLPETAAGPGELHHILLHELVHYRRRDLWVKAVGAVARVLHWFNPLVWLFLRDLDRACEFACDEGVTALLPPESRREYGRAILRVLAEGKGVREAVGVPLCGGARTMKRRLTAIAAGKKAGRWTVFLAAFLAVVLSGAALLAGCAAGPGQPPSAGNGEATAQDAADAFAKTVLFNREDGILSFTTPQKIPKGSRLFLHVSGSLSMGSWDSVMSFHLFEAEEEGGLWELGKEYAAPLEAEGLIDCTVDFALLSQESGEELASSSVRFTGDGTPEQAVDDYFASLSLNGDTLRFTVPGFLPKGCTYLIHAECAEEQGKSEAFPLNREGEEWAPGKEYTYPDTGFTRWKITFSVLDERDGREYASGERSLPEVRAVRFQNPVADSDAYLIQEYEPGQNEGLKIGFQEEGAEREVLACAEGTVHTAGWQGVYGLMLLIDHADGSQTRYAHCGRLFVSEGESVAAGQKIALVGQTGNAPQPMLYFQALENGAAVEPLTRLPGFGSGEART